MEDPLAHPWDDSLRKLVHVNPQAFVHLVDPEAEYLHEINEKLKPLTREVDGLLLTQRKDGRQQLVHIEIQSTNDPTMGERMLIYHVLARLQYDLPILSYVIYLRKDGTVPQPPYQWKSLDEEVVLEFHYRVIELAEMTAEELRSFGEVGLLPLLPLTKGGATRQVAEEMFTELQGAGYLNLLQLGQTIASLAFGDTRPADQEWVLRRYRTMYDRLQETPLYKEMTRLASERAREEALKEAEKAREEALKEAEKARKEAYQEGQLKALREMLLSLVQTRFPKMSGLTKRLASTIDHTSTLQALILKVSMASNLQEARQFLLDIVEEDTPDA